LLQQQGPFQLVNQALELWGRIDIIVNNAAMVCNKPLKEITNEDWDRLFMVNVKAPFFLVQAALTSLKRTRGVVINISSINGVKNDANNLVYDTMKAALNHMTRGLTLDLRNEGIRFNALMPAGIDTPLLKEWFNQKLHNPYDVEKAVTEAKKDPTVGTAHQIADAVVFLVSNRASWINGSIIPIEGGYTIG